MILHLLITLLTAFPANQPSAAALSDSLASSDDSIHYRLNVSAQAGYQGYNHTVNDRDHYLWLFQSANLNGTIDLRGGHHLGFEVDAADVYRGWWINSYLDLAYTENHYLRIGQYTTPFSTENNLSPTSLAHIKRYHALSSLHQLNLAGTGFGLMSHGSRDAFTYYLSATTNLSDHAFSPDRLEFQARADYQFSDDLIYGLSLLYRNQTSESLPLTDHSGSNFSELQINSSAVGALLKSEWFYGRWHTRSELFTLKFTDPVDSNNQAGWYYGSYSELGVHLGSDRDTARHKLIGRLEASQYYNSFAGHEGTERIYSLLAGHYWQLHPILVLRSNVVFHHTDTAPLNTGERYENQRYGFHGLMSLQWNL